MSRNIRRNAFSEVFSLMSDAIAAASAVRARRMPDAQTLRRLGIDPKQFGEIGRG